MFTVLLNHGEYRQFEGATGETWHIDDAGALVFVHRDIDHGWLFYPFAAGEWVKAWDGYKQIAHATH